MEPSHSLPLELLFAIIRLLDPSDLRRARLVCRAFANAGLRCLAPTVTVGRSPASFQKIQFVQNHPILRHNVKKLIYICDQIELHQDSYVGKSTERISYLHKLAAELLDFQASGKDIDGLKQLLQSLPALESVSLESPHLMFFPNLSAASRRLNFPMQDAFYKMVKPHPESIVQAMAVIETISSLHVTGAPPTLIQVDPPRYFDRLVCLDLTFQREFRRVNRTIDRMDSSLLQHQFPLLTHLRLCGILDTFDNGHLPLSFALPPTLKELHLIGVQFSQLDLPPKLERLFMRHARLTETGMSGWVDTLVACTMNCEFSGHLMALESGPNFSINTFCHCSNTLMDTTLEGCLADICSPYCSVELRTEMLLAIFNTETSRYMYKIPQRIPISDSLAERYLQFSNELKERKVSVKFDLGTTLRQTPM